MQHLPSLETLGFEATVSHLFDDGYLADLYAGRRTRVTRVATAYTARLSLRRAIRTYEAIWLEKEAFPWLPNALEHLLLGDAPLLVDYDDAIFHRYDQHSSWAVRRLLGTKIDAVMRHATAVMAGNQYLAERAEKAGARRVVVVPTAVNAERYHPRRIRPPDTPFTVGWIGTPQTARYLLTIANALQRLYATGNVEFVFIGCPPDLDLGVPYDARTWSESTEAADLAALDCGLMPLLDAPFERGKCGYKLIQYMACALPVVASPVGVNAQIVTPGENGFLATTEAEWLTALMEIKRDREAAAQLGANGRRLVEQSYSTRVVTPRISEILREVATGALARRAP